MHNYKLHENDKNIKYSNVIEYLYLKINNNDKIIKDTVIGVIKEKNIKYGYRYYDSLKLSIRGCDANNSIKEIFNQCIKNRFILKIKIKLSGDKFLLIKNIC